MTITKAIFSKMKYVAIPLSVAYVVVFMVIVAGDLLGYNVTRSIFDVPISGYKPSHVQRDIDNIPLFTEPLPIENEPIFVDVPVNRKWYGLTDYHVYLELMPETWRDTFYEYALRIGMSKDQRMVFLALMMCESGEFTAFLGKNKYSVDISPSQLNSNNIKSEHFRSLFFPDYDVRKAEYDKTFNNISYKNLICETNYDLYIQASANFFKYLWDKNKGNVERALMQYNAGESRFVQGTSRLEKATAYKNKVMGIYREIK